MMFAFLLVASLAAPPYQAVVDARYTGAEGARVDGVPTYHTIGGAVAAVPGENRTPFVIYIRDGRYYEKLTVQKPNVTFLGQSRERAEVKPDAMFPRGIAAGGERIGLLLRLDRLGSALRIPIEQARHLRREQHRRVFSGCFADRIHKALSVRGRIDPRGRLEERDLDHQAASNPSSLP